VNVNVYPATTNVPDREGPLVFTAAKMVAAPLPVPELPLLIVIQLVLLTAVHAQVLGAVTEMIAL
jgi:hypothetical protein